MSMMNILLAQMTPYGIYDLKYAKKIAEQGNIKKMAPAANAARVYETVATPSFLPSKVLGLKLSMSQNEYRKNIFVVMSAAKSLTDAAERLIDENWPKPKTETATDVVAATLAENAAIQEHSVEVMRLASMHNFQSRQLSVSEQGFAAKGTYSVLIEKNSEVQKAVFTLGSNDNARLVAYKVADAINSFTKVAYAETSEEKGKITLSVSAVESGKEGVFSLSDDVGDILRKLSVNLVQEGGDGFVRVDGLEHKLKNNHLAVDEGRVKMDFLSIGTVRVNIVADNNRSLYALKTLVNNYNNFKEKFEAADNTTKRAKEMFDTFDNLFSSQLKNNRLAVTLDAEGFLNLHENKCMSLLREDPSLVNNVKDSGHALVPVLYNMANSIRQNPLSTYFVSLTTDTGIAFKFNGIVVDMMV